MDYSRGVLKGMNSPFFPNMRRNLGPYLVDKTKLIINVVDNNWDGDVHLVLRPRRCGKSTMLQMLKSFFSIPQNDDPDPHLLFKDLYVAKHRQDICTEHMGKYPVIFCDFKDLYGKSWEDMLWKFKTIVSRLYRKWEDCLIQSLEPEDKFYYNSICLKTATNAELSMGLYKLTYFLAQKFGRKVIVLIDEYEVPDNRAHESGYFNEANVFFGRGALSALLKSNEYLQCAVLAGITLAAKSLWYTGLNSLEMHALHTRHSIFAGMLMFTEDEVENLRNLSNSGLELKDLRAHYNSYIAFSSAGPISVYNPVSILYALKKSRIENYWVATGEFPLLNREFPDDGLGVIKGLLAHNEIDFEFMDGFFYSNSTLSDLSQDETLTLLYYAGYLTMTDNGRFRIPNLEVMMEWARWIGRDVKSRGSILNTCVEGPVSDFEAKWPNFMQRLLHSKLVSKDRYASNHKTLETIYHVLFLGLMQSLGAKGWEVTVDARAGGDNVDLRLLHKQKRQAVLIELKSSKNEDDMERDANMALEQIVDPEGLPNVNTLREYGMAGCYLNSYVKGRYLELNDRNQWVEKDDPAMSVS